MNHFKLWRYRLVLLQSKVSIMSVFTQLSSPKLSKSNLSHWNPVVWYHSTTWSDIIPTWPEWVRFMMSLYALNLGMISLLQISLFWWNMQTAQELMSICSYPILIPATRKLCRKSAPPHTKKHCWLGLGPPWRQHVMRRNYYCYIISSHIIVWEWPWPCCVPILSCLEGRGMQALLVKVEL